MKVETYTELNDTIHDSMKYIYDLAIHDKHNRYPENYMTHRMNDSNIATSIAYNDNDIPFCISNVIHRDIFNGSVRILNRFYLHTDDVDRKGIRPPNLNIENFIRPATIEMIDQQTDICLNMGYENLFFSRQDETPKILHRMLDGMNVVCKNKDWLYDQNRYWVCGGEPELCAQAIGWKGELCLKLYDN